MTPYDQGAAAYRDGLGLGDNPYIAKPYVDFVLDCAEAASRFSLAGFRVGSYMGAMSRLYGDAMSWRRGYKLTRTADRIRELKQLWSAGPHDHNRPQR